MATCFYSISLTTFFDTLPQYTTWTQVIAAKETGSQAPVKRIENCSFIYTRHLNMYFVALTRSNVNPALVFEYLFQKIRILKAYLGEDFDENSMRNNMTLIYELMDETMDFGYPQNCAVDVLRLYINLGTVRPQVSVVDKSCVQLNVGPMVPNHTVRRCQSFIFLIHFTQFILSIGRTRCITTYITNHRSH